MRPSRELIVLHQLFEAGGVRALAFKGPALAARFGDDPDSRPVADLDFLIDHAELQRATGLLEAHGFQARPRSNGLICELHFVRARPPLCVDLHWHVVPRHLAFPFAFEELWRERQKVVIRGRTVLLPSDIWLLLLAAMYCIREAPLVEHRYFVDLRRLAELLPEACWPEVAARAQRLRSQRLLAITVRTAFALAGSPPPAAFAALFPEDRHVEAAVKELLARARDPRQARKQRFLTYLAHFFLHGRYREHWADRLRPILFFPIFLILPEDDDVERAARSGRPPWIERLLRSGDVVSTLRAAAREASEARRFEAQLADPHSRLAPAADVDLYILGDRGLLFAPHTSELYALTTAATWVWCALAEGWPLGTVVSGLARTFDQSEPEAAAAVRAILRQWWQSGLLEGAPRSPRPQAPRAQGVAQGPPELRAQALAHSPQLAREPAAGRPNVRLCVRLLRTIYELEFSDWAAAERCLPVMSHLTEATASSPGVPVHVTAEAGEWLIRMDGDVADSALDLEELAPQLLNALCIDAVNRHGFDLLLQAAMLVRPEGALLLPAAAGSGKSCLALALAQHGFFYGTDDTVLLAGNPLRATAVPVCAAIREEATALLQPLYPALPALPLHRRVDGRRCRYLPPPLWPGQPVPLEARVRWLVFPTFRAGSPSRRTRLEPVEAITRLIRHCTALTPELDRARVARLVRWMEEIEAWSLEFGKLHEAVHILAEMAVPTE